ncbi:uncharacterized protein [Physcomitrium patens]|uniref:uncharacterized protein isoform X2 n=1 Tax=Physcomitrium patens TaxID=3218 RepID=UPI003CCDFA65
MQFWHVSITTSLVSALNQLVEVMERREASTRTAANRAMGVQIRERPSKRQRRSFETDFLPWSTYASQILFQNLDANADNRQTAAEFLSWIICPSSSKESLHRFSNS